MTIVRLRDPLRGMPVRAWKSMGIRDALLISAIPLAIVFWLIGASVAQYRRMLGFDDFFSRGRSIEESFADRWHAGLSLPGLMGIRQRLDARAADPSVIRLTMAASSFDSLTSNEVGDWTSWAHGNLDYGGTTLRMKARRRGDTSVHWLTEKRSMTVHLHKKEPYKGFASFGLSGKDALEAYVINGLAQKFGVFAPYTDMVPVFVNSRFYGMFRFVEPVDETFLRSRGRLPGTAFRGDRAERGEFERGQPRNLFENPYLWERPVPGDSLNTIPVLRSMLTELSGTSFQDAQRVMARFDTADISRLMTYLLVAGDPYHMDGVHNQILYLDPSAGTFHPVPWDVRLLAVDSGPHPLNDLFSSWLRNPYLVDAIDHQLYAATTDSTVQRAIDSLLTRVETRFADYLAYDRYRGRLIPRLATSDEVQGLVHHNLGIISGWLNDDTVAVAASPGSAGEMVLDLETRGRVGVNLAGLGIAAAGARVWMDANLNGIHDASDPPVATRAGADGTLEFAHPIPLYAGWTTTAGVGAGHVPYRFFVGGAKGVASIPVVATNRVSGRSAAVIPWMEGAAIRPATAWHPWRYARAAGHARRMAGATDIRETTIIPEGDTLVLAPGSNIRLEKGASLISRGRVIARGTASAPIRISASSGSAFAIQGPGADSSVLAYVAMSGGSGARVDAVSYTGALNVHWAHGVTMDHVQVTRDSAPDAALHIVASSVTVSAARVSHARADGIKVEGSSGSVTGSWIDSSGSNGLTSNSSDLRAVDDTVTRSKAAAFLASGVGRPVIFNGLARGNRIGVQAADHAQPLVLNCDLDSNIAGVRVVRGDWRYGGEPWATVIDSRVRRNGIAHETNTRITYWSDERDAANPLARAVRQDLYASLGIASPAAAVGRLASWHPVAVAPPVASERYRDDFEPRESAWKRRGHATRVEQRNDALLLDVQRGDGGIRRAVSWNLSGPGTLVAEVAGRDVARGRLVAESDTGDVAVSFTVSPQSSAFALMALPLPAGHYRALRIEATPAPGLSHVLQVKTGLNVVKSARLYLRSYTVFGASAQRGRS